jgi:hypothetical protein
MLDGGYISAMDARTVARVARIGVATLNLWAQRGLIPGIEVGTRGRRRDFDVPAALQVVVIAELVRFGFGAPFASFIVGKGLHKRLLIGRSEQNEDSDFLETLDTPRRWAAQVLCLGFSSDEEIPAQLERFPNGPPAIYTVINVEELEERVRRAEEEWEQSRGGKK